MPIGNITQIMSTISPPPHRGVDVQTVFVTKQEDFQDHLADITIDELNTLKDQLNSRIGEINSTTTTMNGYATSASSSASTATTKAGEASTSASGALTSRNQAETFKNNASASATKASQWADNAYNVEVETGKYSAKHWSVIAENATSGKIDKVTSTDNAVVRFNGTTGEVQNSSVSIDDNGQMISTLAGVSTIAYTFGGQQASTGVSCPANGILGLNSLAGVLVYGSGGLGYGPGSGGTVTQLTSKSTAVTLNKPTGYINMSNTGLAAGASVTFTFNNSLLSGADTLNIIIYSNSIATQGSYRLTWSIITSLAYITLTNQSASTLTEAPLLNFAIIKGATA